MPRINVDYSKSIIYKLVHKNDYDNVNVYIGSTTDFKSRKCSHKYKCIHPDTNNMKVYQFIRENDGWDAWLMVEIEKFPCKDKREADARERHWCEYYKSDLNMAVPGRKLEEYIKDNKEKRFNSNKIWYEKNKEVQKVKEKKYREKHKEEKKEYYKEKAKKYREENSEKIEEKRFNRKITCDKCGLVIKAHLNNHKKTQKCINFVPILDIQNP